MTAVAAYLVTRGVRARALSGRPEAPVRAVQPARRLNARGLRGSRAGAPGRARPSKAESSALRLLWRRGGVDPRDVWRVLELEAHLAFKAWSSAPRAQRRRARRAYRDALAREAWAAALLEDLARADAVAAER